MNKKRLRRKHRKDIVRVTMEPDYDHEAWHSDIKPTPDCMPDAFYCRSEPVYPKLEPAQTRRKPYTSLTGRKLRKRLYGAGLRGVEFQRVLREVLSGEPRCDGVTFNLPGSWRVSQFRETFGRKVAKAVLRFVAIKFIILDEFGYYVNEGFSEFAQQAMSACRKYSAAPVTVSQLFPTAPVDVTKRVSFQY